MKSFKSTQRMRFHQADPAGWMFFGRAFELAHDALEDFLVDAGFEWKEWFASREFAMPIRKAEADYRKPIPAGAVYQIEAQVTRMGTTSVSFQFRFQIEAELCLVLDSTHVLINTQTKSPVPWPATFRARLAEYLVPVEGAPK